MDKIIALIGARCTPAGTARNTVDHESAPPKAQKLISEAYSKFKQQLHIWIGGLASDQIDTRVQIRITEEIKKELMIVNDEYHLDLQQKSSFFKLCQAILSLPIDMGIHSLIVKKLKQNGILHDSLVKFRNSYSEAELAAFRKAAADPIHQAWIKDNSAKGLPAQELYDFVKAKR